jgi:hypothetical protein
MPKNPLEANSAREQSVRERAYHLWEADGKPHGRDIEHWERARELVAKEEGAGARLRPTPRNRTATSHETGVQEVTVPQNPAEVAAHGAVQPPPAPKKRPRRREKK